MGNNLLMRWYY